MMLFRTWREVMVYLSQYSESSDFVQTAGSFLPVHEFARSSIPVTDKQSLSCALNSPNQYLRPRNPL